MWESLDGKEDKHFFACLILGGEKKYLEAFAIDPNDLSDNMTVAMAEYASRLLGYGKNEAFINLNNALESKINTADNKILMLWFGKCSSYSANEETGISFAGLCNPKALHALGRLEKEGVGGDGWMD